MKSALQPPFGYPELLQELKTRIRGAQVRAALAVNRELVLLELAHMISMFSSASARPNCVIPEPPLASGLLTRKTVCLSE